MTVVEFLDSYKKRLEKKKIDVAKEEKWGMINEKFDRGIIFGLEYALEVMETLMEDEDVQGM